MSVIVLVADGVRADTLARAVDAGSLPALARLRSEGGCYEVTSAFPSVTGPAYAPFLMGRFPGQVGLPGLRWFDRSRKTCTFPDYTRSYVGYQMRALDRDLDPETPTIFELVPDSLAALSPITRGLPKERQLAGLTLLSAGRAAWTHFRGDVSGWLKVDREVSEQVISRVGNDEGAEFVFAAFTGIDKASHAGGHDSGRVLEALAIIDGTVAALRRKLEARGTWQDTRLWITSDHGHSPVRHHEDLERVVEGMGHRVIAHPWVYGMGADVAVMVSGNAMAHVYVDLACRPRPFLSGMSESGRLIADRLLSRDSVDILLVPLDEARCAVWSRTRGRATVARTEGRYSYLTTEGDPLGVGRDFHELCARQAHEATLHTDYPDSVVQIARLASSERAGDLILSAARDWDFRARYEPIPHVSSHGALHREHMIVPLLLNHAPARTPRRTSDIMPSALAALGREVPAGLDGESFV